jgi:hypothetical protein
MKPVQNNATNPIAHLKLPMLVLRMRLNVIPHRTMNAEPFSDRVRKCLCYHGTLANSVRSIERPSYSVGFPMEMALGHEGHAPGETDEAKADQNQA